MIEYYASYIPSIVGANQYKDQHLEIIEQRFKYFKKKGIIVDKELERLSVLEKEYKKKFSDGVSKSKVAILTAQAEREENASERKEIIKKLSRTVYGNFNEKVILEKLLEEQNITVTDNNKENFSLEYDGFKVLGRIDGFTVLNDEKYLVEIKSRVGAFKEKIPFYELVQITVLMKLTNTEKCLFVQSSRNFIRTGIIKFDKELYEKIISILSQVTPLIKEQDEEKFKSELKNINKLN